MRRPALPLQGTWILSWGVYPKVCSLPLVICGGFVFQEKGKLEVSVFYWKTVVCFPTQYFLSTLSGWTTDFFWWLFPKLGSLRGPSLMQDLSPVPSCVAQMWLLLRPACTWAWLPPHTGLTSIPSCKHLEIILSFLQHPLWFSFF